jgi:conjugal transfer pilus assembly protein TraK
MAFYWYRRTCLALICATLAQSALAQAEVRRVDMMAAPAASEPPIPAAVPAPVSSPSSQSQNPLPNLGPSKGTAGSGAPAAQAVRPARVTIGGAPTVKEVQRAPSPPVPPTSPARSLAGEAPPSQDRDKRLPALRPDDPSLKPFVLHTRIGVNEVVTVSSRLLNRISTPFQDLVVIDTSGAQFKVVGSELFLLPASDEPAGIYLFDKSNPTQTISLTLVPQGNIPGQNILIKIEDFRALGNLALASSASSVLAAKPADYESVLTQILVSAVNGKIPGFNAVPLQTSVALIDDIEVEPDVVFQGSAYDVYRYRLRNTSGDEIALNEGVFYREGVRAVSFFPRNTLKPQESTYVFMVADKANAPGSVFQSKADEEVVNGKKD